MSNADQNYNSGQRPALAGDRPVIRSSSTVASGHPAQTSQPTLAVKQPVPVPVPVPAIAQRQPDPIRPAASGQPAPARDKTRPGFGVASAASQPLEPPIPHNTEAEEAVIGALLIDPNAILEVSDLLSVLDFYHEELGNVYQAVNELYQSGKPADIINLKNELNNQGLLGDGDGQVKQARLLSLMRQTPSAAYIKDYAEIVREKAYARRLIKAGAEITKLAFNASLKPGDQQAKSDDLLRQLGLWLIKESDKSLLKHKDTFQVFANLGQNQPGNSGQPPAVPQMLTGFQCFDGRPANPGMGDPGEPPSILLQPATITLFMGRPASGKTAVVEQIAANLGEQGFSVLFCHNELSHSQLVKRRACRTIGIPYWKVETDQLNGAELKQIIEVSAKIDLWPGEVDFLHCPGWSGTQLVIHIKKLQQSKLTSASAKPYDCIIWDYIQRAGAPEDTRYLTREDQIIRYNLKAFSDLANQLNAVGIVTSQIKRADREDPDERPSLASGAGGAAIEELSNQMIGVWRKEQQAEFIILKNTFGVSEETKQVDFVRGAWRG